MAKRIAIGCAWAVTLALVTVFTFPTLVRDATQYLYATITGR